MADALLARSVERIANLCGVLQCLTLTPGLRRVQKVLFSNSRFGAWIEEPQIKTPKGSLMHGALMAIATLAILEAAFVRWPIFDS